MQNKNIFYASGIIIFLVFFYFFFSFLFSAPADFPVGTIFRIERGDSLRSVSLRLKQNGIVRSRAVFEAFVTIFGSEKNVIYSDYHFEDKLPVYEIARRIGRGEHHIAPTVVTIPEGFNVSQIAEAFAAKLSNFDKNKFLAEAKEQEGYLFPDTYYFLTNDTEQDVIKSMRENFEKKTLELEPGIALSHHSLRDIIIMASLIEGEAKGEKDSGFISGILWKRFAMDIPLQVDVSSETYKIKGLPKNPINNPGMQAIKAAIYPQKSSYLYYLHDKDGNIHYATSFSLHERNVLMYLK